MQPKYNAKSCVRALEGRGGRERENRGSTQGSQIVANVYLKYAVLGFAVGICIVSALGKDGAACVAFFDLGRIKGVCKVFAGAARADDAHSNHAAVLLALRQETLLACPPWQHNPQSVIHVDGVLFL